MDSHKGLAHTLHGHLTSNKDNGMNAPQSAKQLWWVYENRWVYKQNKTWKKTRNVCIFYCMLYLNMFGIHYFDVPCTLCALPCDLSNVTEYLYVLFVEEYLACFRHWSKLIYHIHIIFLPLNLCTINKYIYLISYINVIRDNITYNINI